MRHIAGLVQVFAFGEMAEVQLGGEMLAAFSGRGCDAKARRYKKVLIKAIECAAITAPPRLRPDSTGYSDRLLQLILKGGRTCVNA